MSRAIYAYVSKSVHTRFFQYSAHLGFKASEAAKYVALRELRIQRLDRLDPSGINTRRGVRGEKITAHLPPLMQMEFVRHAKARGLTPSLALGIVIRRELKERSLLRALSS